MDESDGWKLPVWWWGPLRSDRSRYSIADLIGQGVLDRESADWLAKLIGLGASTIVCAGPSGAGKTSLLTALMPFIAQTRKPYFVRGMFDPLSEPHESPASNRVLLINEISPHLPIYLWGPAANRVFDLGCAGAQLLATAHADRPESLIHQMMAYPTNARVEHLRLWDLVIFLDAWREGPVIRRQIREIVSLSGEVEQGIAVERLALRAGRDSILEWDRPTVDASLERVRGKPGTGSAGLT